MVVANYGEIPYGTTFVGSLLIPYPINGCEQMDSLTIGERLSKIKNPIFIMRRGDCKFTLKTRHAQIAGAKVALFVDDRDNDEEIKRGFGSAHGAIFLA
jgi:PA domain.